MRQLFLLLALTLIAAELNAQQFYVDRLGGDDGNPGTHSLPFKTIARAVKEVDGGGGTIELNAEGGPFREPITLKHGGTYEKPLVIEGHGATINLGIDVTTGPWISDGDGFVLDRPVRRNDRFWLATLAFVNGLPLSCYREGDPRQTKAWHGGSACYTSDGRLRIVFPKGLMPNKSVVVLTGGPDGASTSGLQLRHASNVRIKGLTVVFAANDGFNFHAGGKNIILWNVKGLFNGDNGTSAHENCQVEVVDSEFAFNGGGDGAVEDIQGSLTMYRNIRVHHNRGDAFLFPKQNPGAHHEIKDSVSFANGRSNGIDPLPPDLLVQGLKAAPVSAGTQTIPVIKTGIKRIDPSLKIDESDVLERFLQNRPPVD